MNEEKYVENLRASNKYLKILLEDNKEKDKIINDLQYENDRLKEILEDAKKALEINNEKLVYSSEIIDDLSENVGKLKKMYKNLQRRYDSLSSSKLGKLTLKYRELKKERKIKSE